MDGFQVTKKIRENELAPSPTTSDGNRKIIIALTANALKGTRERCLASGMDDYLSKPISFDLLKNILRKHLN
jgi:CheY-like chemotaxis protein